MDKGSIILLPQDLYIDRIFKSNNTEREGLKSLYGSIKYPGVGTKVPERKYILTQRVSEDWVILDSITPRYIVCILQSTLSQCTYDRPELYYSLGDIQKSDNHDMTKNSITSEFFILVNKYKTLIMSSETIPEGSTLKA